MDKSRDGFRYQWQEVDIFEQKLSNASTLQGATRSLEGTHIRPTRDSTRDSLLNERCKDCGTD